VTRRRGRWTDALTAPPRWVLAGVVAVVVLAAGWVGVPWVLRRLDFFRVRQIELVGVRYLAPDAVIGSLALAPGASVFDPTAPLVRRVERLPGVAGADVQRRLPGALRVVVREVEPAAFVPGPRGLMPVDAGGHPLPFDPARVAIDLPVVADADSGVIAVLALVRSLNPTMFHGITSVRRLAHGDVQLDLGTHRVLVRRDAGPEDVQAVELVQQDLAAKRRPYAELDVRFAGQVVVRRKAST
jgi:cell division protein FtsQ